MRARFLLPALLILPFLTAPERHPERVYATAEAAPEGHAEDMAYITTFRRL